jgi:hypothetical protein
LACNLFAMLEELCIDSARGAQGSHPRVALATSFPSASCIHGSGIHSSPDGNRTAPHPGFIDNVDVFGWNVREISTSQLIRYNWGISIWALRSI